MARQVANWIDGFMEFMKPSGSPEQLVKWAGICAIAGALERKVWVYTAGSNLYPNLYVFLVSRPGVGKSRALNAVHTLWQELTDHKTAPSSLTKASLIDELENSHRTIVRIGQTPATVEFHSLKVLISELGVFLPEFANDFMNTLTDLYDGYPYGERRRTRNISITIPKPQLNILAGTTPSYLNTLLPEGAWDQGFLSRTILIYADNLHLTSLFATTVMNKTLQKQLQTTLNHIGNLYGEMTFTSEAAHALDHWYLNGQLPQPNHPKLQNYKIRRPVHLLKLCQIAAVNEGDKLEINIGHVNQAMSWLVEAESVMPEIFKAMATGGDGKVMDEAWHLVYQYKIKMGSGLPRALLIKFLTLKVPTYKVEQVIDLMEQSNMLSSEAVKGKGIVYHAKEGSIF